MEYDSKIQNYTIYIAQTFKFNKIIILIIIIIIIFTDYNYCSR